MPTKPNSKFTEVQGIKMHYLEWGDPGAPDVLLVHGWTGMGSAWAGVAESLKDRYHVIAPDHRGHGESDKPVTGYRLRDFVEDMRQLIKNLNLKRPAFVGHSWGGNIGTIMAADCADDIRCAFLEDPVYWKIINAFVTSLAQAMARHNRPEAEIREDGKRRGLTPEQIDEEVYRHHHFSPHAITRLLSDNREWALVCEEYMKRVKAPTLVLAADINAGGYMIPEELEYYRRIASPQLKFRLWEGVGHMMHGTRPDQFNKELAEFLSENK
jgi:pimeloyl-ACP methyl ester carboxylesterase